jgi:hypothetical protein
MKHLVKKGRRIKGFVFEQNGSWWYAFGRPSQDNYISFACDSLEQGIARVEMNTNHF